MVHSNGTRLESQRFRIDFTGSRKYSGRSSDFRAVSAAGEQAARRAMPTSVASASRVRPSAKSGSPPVSPPGGGQSAAGLPGLLPLGPASSDPGEPAQTVRGSPESSIPDHGCCGFGPCVSGLRGKSAACVTGRRRTSMIGAVVERTGDMAHLTVPPQYFAFLSPCQPLFSSFIRLPPPLSTLLHSSTAGVSSHSSPISPPLAPEATIKLFTAVSLPCLL